MQATAQRRAMLQTNRWARFMADVVSNFRVEIETGNALGVAAQARVRNAPFSSGEVNAKLLHRRARVNGGVTVALLGQHTAAFCAARKAISAAFCFLFVAAGECGLLGWKCGATLPDLRAASLARLGLARATSA